MLFNKKVDSYFLWYNHPKNGLSKTVWYIGRLRDYCVEKTKKSNLPLYSVPVGNMWLKIQTVYLADLH